ncbi:adenylosuccinate synthetase [Desulfovibrionales bacterium]
MASTVVIGSQWGDEGKGKIVDLLTEAADVVVRFQGGNNAGHTLVVGERKVTLHLIPSGILHAGCRCCIGNGVVLDPEIFSREVNDLAAWGLDVSPGRLIVSPKVHLITPWHRELDDAREAARPKGQRIGTTGRGIGPCYEDKVGRIGIRAADLADPSLLRQKIKLVLNEKNALLVGLYDRKPLDLSNVLDWALGYADQILPYLGDVSAVIIEAQQAGKHVLFEGAQGVHLDIDHGTYPFVTSSSTVAGSAASGSGCGSRGIDRIIAVVKAYTTRVGSGPFPTELFDATGDALQRRGVEFGATTGRKRRCGWLDLVLLAESVRLTSPSELAITKLDVLSGLSELKLCVSYEYQGRRLAFPPQIENGLTQVTPMYEVVPGWQEDISACRSLTALPVAARAYIERMEVFLGVPVSIISVGPDRTQIICY